jgi:putative hydrolase of the HAD superfamily
MENHKINAEDTLEIKNNAIVSNGVKAIIFDLGNVLIDFDHRIAAKRIVEFTDRSSQEIFDLFFDSDLSGLFEEGKLSPLEFFSQIKEMLKLRLDYDKFVPIWNEIFFLTKKNSSVYNLASRLKEHYKLALLSNVNILHFQFLLKTFPVFGAFHHLITSYEVGVRKPHPLIYKKTLELMRVSPHEVFYTDDRPELIENARRLGIKGSVFVGIEQLKKDFLEIGINI